MRNYIKDFISIRKFIYRFRYNIVKIILKIRVKRK